MTEGLLRLDAVEIHYRDLGEGEPMVLVHGFAGSVADWERVLPKLAERCRVIAYDHRGHGRSGNLAERDAYTFDDLVADLHALISGLDLGPVHLVGHSMGGVVAQMYALARPAAVRSLVLVDTSAEPSGRVLRTLLGTIGRAISAVVRRARRDRMDPEAFVALGRGLADHPSLLRRLPEIRCPVTVIVGERDRGLRAKARRLASGIPGARLVVVPGSGHLPQVDRPERWLEIVFEHLDRV